MVLAGYAGHGFGVDEAISADEVLAASTFQDVVTPQAVYHVIVGATQHAVIAAAGDDPVVANTAVDHICVVA